MQARVKMLNLLFKSILSYFHQSIEIINFNDGNFAIQIITSEETSVDYR